MRDAVLITLIVRDCPSGSPFSPDPAWLASLLQRPRRVWVNEVDQTRTFLFEEVAVDGMVTAEAAPPPEPTLGFSVRA